MQRISPLPARRTKPVAPTLRTLVVGALTTLLVACGEPTQNADDDVVLSVSPGELASGDPLVAKVVNRSGGDVTLHFCDLVIQFHAQGGWEPENPQPDTPRGGLCPTAPIVLNPGATHQQVAPFPSALAPGSYRLWLHIESGGSDSMISSPEFRIRG